MSETPMLDALETGPWPVFFTGSEPEPRCSTCQHGPCVECKHIKECRAGSKWEGKHTEAQKALEGR